MEKLVAHDIFAGNQLLGEGLIFRLSLPPEWQLAPGVSHPEVAAMHERRRQNWVASGSAWYVVYNESKRWAMELATHIRPLKAKPLAKGEDTTSIGGHEAQLIWRMGRRGLPWKRHDVRFMTVKFDCPLSERRIEIELSGKCQQEGFQEMLAVLNYLRCH